MKKIIIMLGFILAGTTMGIAQAINWRSINEEQMNVANINIGYDYGVVTQAGYGRIVNAFSPILLTLDFSIPMGKNTFDDLKVRVGGQIELYEINGFSISGKIMANFRKYETDLVRVVSFGSEFSAIAGYYKPTWHLAGEFGFDKSINSNLKHSELMKDIHPQVTDGWYIPSGGHFFYGIQGSKTLGENLEISLRIGMTNAERKDQDAEIPFYLNTGLTIKF